MPNRLVKLGKSQQKAFGKGPIQIKNLECDWTNILSPLLRGINFQYRPWQWLPPCFPTSHFLSTNFPVCLPHLFSFPLISVMHIVKQRQQLTVYHLQLQTSHIDSHMSPACLFREHLCADTAQRGYGLIFRCSRQLTLCTFFSGYRVQSSTFNHQQWKTRHIKLGTCLNLEVEQRDKTAW